MARSDRRADLPVSPLLHRNVHWIIVGLAVWLLLSVWGFAGTGYTGLVLTVVSLFIGIAVMLPLTMWQIAKRRSRIEPDDDTDPSFGEWLSRDFDAQSGRVKASAAAVEIILPIAAVAIGMTVFALVRHFDLA